jgi:hypothetical protein
MPDRPPTRDAREGPIANTPVLIGVVLAAVLALLLIFGAPMFNSGEKSVDVNKTQPNIEAPVTGDNKKP